MKKVSKAILIGLAIVLALVVVLIVGLNLYVQSPGAQARIQEELSKMLRLPLKITKYERLEVRVRKASAEQYDDVWLGGEARLVVRGVIN